MRSPTQYGAQPVRGHNSGFQQQQRGYWQQNRIDWQQSRTGNVG